MTYFFLYIYKITLFCNFKALKMKRLFILCFAIFSATITYSQYPTGLEEASDEDYSSIPKIVPLVTRSFTSLPSSYSLKAYCPTPKSQGTQSSCVGWASAHGARTISNAVKNGWENNPSKINANTFSPAFIYNSIKNPRKYDNSLDTKCERGSSLTSAALVLKKFGVVKNVDFPYNVNNCSTKPTNYLVTKASEHKISHFEKLNDKDSNSSLVNNVKKAISKKHPVLFGLFNYDKIIFEPGTHVYKRNSGKNGHALVVVGYDDNKYGGAFEIMNSWGSWWGNKGFFWIKYEDYKAQAKENYVIVDQIEDPKPNPNYITSNNLGGEMTLTLSSGNNMPVSLAEGATRNFNIVKASKTTYKVNKAYSSGTQFRIYLKSKQRGYVYLIGYGSSDKSVNKLYPFGGYSDFFNYTNSEIALPNEDYFIEFDNKPGRDILCVLYSKEKLNINDIVNKAKYGSEDFVSRIKKALSTKMFKGSDVTFSSNKIAFNASSKSTSAKIVPVFIEMNHQ